VDYFTSFLFYGNLAVLTDHLACSATIKRYIVVHVATAPQKACSRMAKMTEVRMAITEMAAEDADPHCGFHHLSYSALSGYGGLSFNCLTMSLSISI